MRKTFSQKPADVTREWFLVDASEAPLGRMAVVVADKLSGKSKITFTPHVDGGDYVVVINAGKVMTTGDKERSKSYHHHSGYIGGLRSLRLEEVKEKQPERIVIEAVKGMLPKNKLVDGRLARLKVFASEEHAHTAQTPKKLEIK
ncbi:50S ribosomal protein L13 [Candidatus Saccharibacteria bacterium]|nr:50S ribosomal protein L13 [Candidatus Saccharibacteria bacterium]